MRPLPFDSRCLIGLSAAFLFATKVAASPASLIRGLGFDVIYVKPRAE